MVTEAPLAQETSNVWGTNGAASEWLRGLRMVVGGPLG
jgi:hypothetical protein